MFVTFLGGNLLIFLVLNASVISKNQIFLPLTEVERTTKMHMYIINIAQGEPADVSWFYSLIPKCDFSFDGVFLQSSGQRKLTVTAGRL